jgi:hypothetical protein
VKSWLVAETVMALRIFTALCRYFVYFRRLTVPLFTITLFVVPLPVFIRRDDDFRTHETLVLAMCFASLMMVKPVLCGVADCHFPERTLKAVRSKIRPGPPISPT